MTPRLPLLALGLAAVVAGCGSTASSGGSGAYSAPAATATATASSPSTGRGSTLRLTADPGGALRFNTTHLTAKAGTVKLLLTNPSSSGMPHGIAIQGHGSGPVVAAGKTTSITATLKKGTYTFLCPVPGHAAAGMKGTLTVS